MIFSISKSIIFSNYYKKLNIFSLMLVILSILILFLKGLNLGVDFKGGTLIEIRAENSKVDIINKNHLALNYPNKILLEDFDNWVQERGLYFPTNWSNDYETLISSNDSGEKPNHGGILISKIGKGHYVYTSYSWFRQLPSGVSGAYNLFVNLISLGIE